MKYSSMQGFLFMFYNDEISQQKKNRDEISKKIHKCVEKKHKCVKIKPDNRRY